MPAITSWWTAEQLAPLAPALGHPEAPARGTFGGQCHHVTCRTTGADWFNRQNGRYYCDECARGLNEMCLNQGLPKICELHL